MMQLDLPNVAHGMEDTIGHQPKGMKEETLEEDNVCRVNGLRESKQDGHGLSSFFSGTPFIQQ